MAPDPEVLEALYCEKRYPLRRIAQAYDVHRLTVSRWMERAGIPRRSSAESKRQHDLRQPVPYKTDDQGYESWHHCHEYERHVVRVHRLLAVAEYGLEAVEDRVVHHQRDVPWLNTPGNIEVLTRAEHRRAHAEAEATE